MAGLADRRQRETRLVAECWCSLQFARRRYRNTRQLLLPIHQVIDVEHEVRGHARRSMTMRHWIEDAAQLGMFCDVALDVVQTFTRRLQHLVELHARLHLGL